MSIYAAVLRGADPVDIPAIDSLKALRWRSASVEAMSSTVAATTVASIVGGEVRRDAPGGRLTSTNPARTDDVVAEVLLGDAADVRRRLRAPPAPRSRSGPRCRRPPAGA